MQHQKGKLRQRLSFGEFLEKRCRALFIAAAISVAVLMAAGGILFSVAILPAPSGAVSVTVPDLREESVPPNSEYFTLNVLYELDESLPAGSFISQYPPAGATRKVILGERKCALRLTLSRGKKTVMLPNLTGYSLSDARQRLDGLGISAKIIYTEGEAGSVVSALPQFGTDIPLGGDIILYVGKQTDGRAPDTVGLSEREARALLEECGFWECDVIYIRSAHPAGTVISQFPLSGEPVGQNKISLTVSRGEG